MFSLDRQALAFLAVIALVALLMVFLAPFALLALGGLGVVLIVATWLKAAIRARRVLAPFGPIEGALALSSLLLVVGAATVSGLMVARLGLGEAVSLGGAMLPVPSTPRPGWRSVWYSNAETQQRLKDGLTKAGIPFRTRMEGGKEYVSWPPEHDAAAEKVSQEARDGDVQPPSHGIGIDDPKMRAEFMAWLAKRDIKSAIVRREDREYVMWNGGNGVKLFQDFLNETRGSKCGDEKTKAKPKAKC